MSVAAKRYNTMLTHRICEALESIFSVNQAGFRESRSCPEHVRLLRRIIEGRERDKNRPLFATFL